MNWIVANYWVIALAWIFAAGLPKIIECHIIMETASKDPGGLLSSSISRRNFFFQYACQTVISGQVLIASPHGATASVVEDDNNADTAESLSSSSSSKNYLNPTTTAQQGGGKPYAPVEALLPAMRCKIWIDRAYSIASQLQPVAVQNMELKVKLLKDLNTTLSNRPKLFRSSNKNNEQQQRPPPLQQRQRNNNNPPVTGATAQITASVSNVNKDQYQKNRENLSLPNKMAAMLNQADVERQWGMLQYAQSKQDKENQIRAALNYYTQQLVFGDSYLLTASKEDKKRMIRNDQLPSLTAVITSDLDLRDLFRNQLLTAIDDVSAEVVYQVNQPETEMYIEDVVSLMNQAHSACDNWFNLIPTEDVKEAFDTVANEDPS